VDVPPAPVDALAQPTRARLFTLLGELRRPAGTDELARRLELHPNGVRLHLERLQAEGLVLRERERQAVGRPRDSWSISPEAQPGGDPPTGYANLGRWLVRAIAAGATRVRDVEATGRQIGRELAPDSTGASPEERIYGVLVAMGFQPRRRFDEGGTLTYCLDNCPYRAAVRERQSVVCGLHRGLTRGLLDEIDPKTSLSAFVPKDPDAAGCEITLRGPLVKEACERADEAAASGYDH
jgi:predicted ArsR family transcriptional regulator